MDNLNYQYLDQDFSQEMTDQYTLLVQADDEQFSFAVTYRNKLLALAEGIAISELTSPTAEEHFLFKSYKQRIIGLSGSAFTFIPASVFDPEKAADFARFLDVKTNEKVFSQPLDTENQAIFKVGEKLSTLITDKFDLQDVVFAPKGWITAIAGGEPAYDNLYLNITTHKVDILNFIDGKLRFYNHFEFQNEDELVYFTSLVAGELQLSPDSVTLILSGYVELNDKNMGRLSDFFNKVELNTLKTIGLPKQLPTHSSLMLTALSLCGSSGVL